MKMSKVIFSKHRKKFGATSTRIKERRSAQFKFKFRVQRPFRYVIGPVARKLYSLTRIFLIFLYTNPIPAFIIISIFMIIAFNSITQSIIPILKIICFLLYFFFKSLLR
jgi:hypothetical protein